MKIDQKLYFSYESNDEPDVSQSGEWKHDFMTIKDYYEFCRSFAYTIGFVHGSVDKYFPESD